ncbi:MAG: molybdenum cofactor guanylyltransferase [Tepidisphaeraceae bacterium]
MTLAGLHPQSDVTLAVLAGGKGRRMGLPKARLQIHGVPILKRLLDQCQWHGPTLLVTSPGTQRPPAAECFDRESVDPVDDVGPLRGVLTALRNAGTKLVLVATADMPGIRRIHLDWLVAELTAEPRALALLLRRSVPERCIEPFPSIFHTDFAAAIDRRLQSGRDSVRSLADEPQVRVVDAPTDWDAATWLNLNYPSDLDRVS